MVGLSVLLLATYQYYIVIYTNNIYSAEAEYDAKLAALKEKQQQELSAAAPAGEDNENGAASSTNDNNPTIDEAAEEALLVQEEDVVEKVDKKKEKARRKREQQRQAALERERQIADELAQAGPSPRDLELERLRARLPSRRYRIRPVTADGNCLYRAVAAQHATTDDVPADAGPLRRHAGNARGRL